MYIVYHRALVERRSSTRACRSSRGVLDFSAISLQNFTKLTGFNLDRCSNLSVKGHQNQTSLWLFFPAPTTTPTLTTTATPLYSFLLPIHDFRENGSFFFLCFIKLALYIQVFELGPEGGDNETDGEVLAETDEMPYECGAR